MAIDGIPEYDVIIIGAGPAGACAARRAVQEGVRVLLADRRTRPGTPVQCA
jgi:flavin-dependent dehydrogenase